MVMVSRVSNTVSDTPPARQRMLTKACRKANPWIMRGVRLSVIAHEVSNFVPIFRPFVLFFKPFIFTRMNKKVKKTYF